MSSKICSSSHQTKALPWSPWEVNKLFPRSHRQRLYRTEKQFRSSNHRKYSVSNEIAPVSSRISMNDCKGADGHTSSGELGPGCDRLYAEAQVRRGALAERGMAAGRLGRVLCVAPAECSSMCSNYTHKNHSQDMPFCIPTNRQNRGSSHDLMHKKNPVDIPKFPSGFWGDVWEDLLLLLSMVVKPQLEPSCLQFWRRQSLQGKWRLTGKYLARHHVNNQRSRRDCYERHYVK